MPINEKLANVFREEAAEHLASLETILLELDQHPADVELIAQAFRVLHTIKGSAAMAGFDPIVAFVHEVESVFAQIRQGHLPITPDIVALTLETKDLVHAMLEPGRLECPPRCQPVREAFRAILAPALESVPVDVPPVSPTAAQAGDGASLSSYRIVWAPHPNFFQNGTSLLGIAAELAGMGTCQISTDLSTLPRLEDLDPTVCHLRIELVLRTSHSEAEIRDVFIFVEDLSDLKISPVLEDASPIEKHATVDPPVAVVAAPPAGQIVPDRVSQVADSTSSIRVSASKLDELVDLVGELVIAQARLAQLASLRADDQLLSVAEDIERLSSELRNNTLDIRMVPIGTTFVRLKRLVHDLSSELGKSIQLQTEGAETELDKTVMERLSDPLVHLIRNSCDHGIESPEVRRERGKSPVGVVRLLAYHSGQSVFVEIHDDGAGMDPEAIRRKAIASGLLDEGTPVSNQDLYKLIFLPGFTTAKNVTKVSGRGVGMDVVKRSVEALRGQIEISSELGRGTTFRLQLPLTLAIIEGLLVAVGDARFVLPMAMVEECVELTALDIERSHGSRLANVRGELVPYLRLREWSGGTGQAPAIEQIAITVVDGKRYGFAIDRVVGQHQTVIKSLGRMHQNVRGLSGATILGDGSVALIIDIPALLHGVQPRAV